MKCKIFYILGFALTLCGCKERPGTSAEEIERKPEGGNAKTEFALSEHLSPPAGDISPMVLSANYGVCVSNQLPGVVSYQDGGGDFTPGKIRFGSGSSFREVEYAIGTRFDKNLRYTERRRSHPSSVRVSSLDDPINKLTSIKVDGFNSIENMEIIFSFPIGDKLSLDYTDQSISMLIKCRVVVENN